MVDDVWFIPPQFAEKAPQNQRRRVAARDNQEQAKEGRPFIGATEASEPKGTRQGVLGELGPDGSDGFIPPSAGWGQISARGKRRAKYFWRVADSPTDL